MNIRAVSAAANVAPAGGGSVASKVPGLIAILILTLLALVAAGCGNGEASAADADDTSTSAENSNAEESTDVAEGDTDGKDATGEDDDDDEDTEEAVPVEVAALEHGSIESVLQFSSSLEVESQVKVFSEAKRLVRELLVEEGDNVDQNQLLLRLEDAEQRSAVSKVQSELAKADREYERKKRLFDQELISDQEFRDATFEVEQLRIGVADAQRELSYTEVRAPIAGTITARMVNLGDQVQIGQELFDMMDFDTMVARIFVPEKHLPQLRPGLSARVTAAATGDREFIARVQRVSPVVDARSGTVKVTVDVGRQVGLRPGLYVDVDLVTSTHDDAVLVPKRAVVYDSDQMFVYRMDDESRVERVYFEPLLTDKHFIEPTQDLGLGDRVVIAGQAGLKHGALVETPGQDEVAAETGDPETEETDEVVEITQRAEP